MEKKQDVFEGETEQKSNFAIDDKNFDMAKYIKEEIAGKKHDNEIDVGDWSVCDHVCGGGMSMKMKNPCIPAVGGYQCHKKPIKLKKSCNTQPCKPGEDGGKLDIPDQEWKFRQPTITLPITLESRFVSHR